MRFPIGVAAVLFGVFFALSLSAAPRSDSPFYSQSRFSWESSRDAGERHAPPEIRAEPTSAANVDVPWNSLDLSSVPAWPSEQALWDGFRRMRDERFLYQYSHEVSAFPRRISWLYPDDGCYARSALSNQKLEEWGYPRPKKLFIFGNLVVRTPNDPSGQVAWWYHVAPVVSVGGKYFVLDAAIEPTRPLPLLEWISRMDVSEKTSTASLCTPYTYHAWRPCYSAGREDESEAYPDQLIFLDLEWQRLEQMGRFPQSELGNSPPWAGSMQYAQ